MSVSSSSYNPYYKQSGGQQQHGQLFSHPSRKTPPSGKAGGPICVHGIVFFAFVMGLVIGLSFFGRTPDNEALPLQTMQQSCPQTFEGRALPKILWIFSYVGWEAEPGNLHIYTYHLKEVAARNGFEVRVVDSWNAYDWISAEMTKRVSRTIQNTQLDETVSNLLKLALLIEHGGVMVGDLDTIFVDGNLQWIERMFGRGARGDEFTCDPSRAQVYMPSFQDARFGTKYYENVIAALPRTALLYETFQFLEDVLVTGVFPGNDEVGVVRLHFLTNVNYLDNSIDNCLSWLLRLRARQSKQPRDDCEAFGMQGTVRESVIDLDRLLSKKRGKLNLLFKGNWQEIPQEMAINADCQIVKKGLGRVLRDSEALVGMSNRSLMHQVLKLPGNEEVFLRPLPPRDIQLCLVVMEGLDKKGLQEMASSYQEQTYHNWRLVLFAKDEVVEAGREYVEVVKSSGNEVRNIEVAVTRHCDHKGYAVLLHQGDRFSSPKALELIAEAVKDRQVVGAAIDLEHHGKLYEAKEDYLSFSRSVEGVVNPKLDKMKGILNNFRVFAIESFRYLPQFDWRDMYGEYFEDRFIFLMSLLELISLPETTKRFQFIYLNKKYAPIFNVPQKATLVSREVRILTSRMNELNHNMLKRTRARYDVQSITQSINSVLVTKVSFSRLLVFNNGDEFVPPSHANDPDIIPKIIHQVWLGGKMPISKSYFFEKTRRMYPHYEMKLWGEANITRENFPLTYEVIMNLLDFQKNRNTGKNKLATITDIMRHEILYNEGGFWRDAGEDLLRPVFDKFLKYRLVIGSERTGRFRWSQGMCFFANPPKVKNLFRITNYPNINKMRVYQDDALFIAGPLDFRQVVSGYEENDPDILMLSYEMFYPGELDRPPQQDLCTKWQQDYIEGEPFQFKYKGCYYLPRCEEKYPYSMGIDHNCFGGSWKKKNDE